VIYVRSGMAHVNERLHSFAGLLHMHSQMELAAIQRWSAICHV